MLQAELPLELERHVESSCRSRRPCLGQKILWRMVGEKGDVIAMFMKRVRGQEAGLPGPDNSYFI